LSVTAIIPAYNAELTLTRSVDSLLAVTGCELDILLVDNNSEDKTLNIMKSSVAKAPGKVKLFKSVIQGVCAARNLGLQHAGGRWIQFLDADDTIAPDKISHQLEKIDSDTKWVIGGYRIVSPGQEDVDNIPHEDPWKGLVYQYRIGCTHANLYRKTALETIGGWDESLPDNTDPNLHFELLKAGLKYQVIPEILSFYHQHPSPHRLSKKAPIASNLRRIDLLERVNDYLCEHRPDYWSTNQDYFLAALLRALRILATHDLNAASLQFEHLQQAGKISINLPNQSIISKKILSAYRIAGFIAVERLRLVAANVLPSGVKEWLKR
jgi:glycosyltransferase involved in cell wall biosynthesis